MSRALVLCVCGAALVAAAGANCTGAAARAPWSFEANFAHGIPGWISYPLAQDEGYDPSLYTAHIGGKPALVRDVTAYGQHVLRVGVLRPVRFHATPSSFILLRYNLQACGPIASVRVILASESGKKYAASLPSGDRENTVRVGGRQFGIPAGGAAIDAVVLEAEIVHPLRGSHNRLMLFSFRIDAQRALLDLLTAAPQPTAYKIEPHPRLLLTASRLEQLRSMAGSLALLQSVGREAARLRNSLAYNREAGLNIALLSPDSVFPGLIQYFQLMENYSQAIALNALDYRLSGDAAALDAARKALRTIATWPTWTPPWFHAHGLQTYYEVGVFTQRVAAGYDLIAGQLTPEEKLRIAGALWRNSIQPTLTDYFFNDRLPIASSNHMANSVGGALAACAALYGDVPGWNERLGAAISELTAAYERLLRGLFPGDGSEAEPAGYEDFAMEGMSYGAAALKALGIRPRSMDRMDKGFWWLRYVFFAPGEVLDTGDTSGNLSSLSGYAWIAKNASDPAARAFYDSAKEGTLAAFVAAARAGGSPQPPSLLDLACCTRPAAGVPEPPLARIFAGRGSAAMRSGWTPGSTVISLRVGPWFNHEHHDEGSFQAAAFGEPLIAEAGYADYYRDPRYADYFSQAPGHNVVLLDHDPFSQEDYDGRYWPALQRYPSLRAHVFSKALDFISANLAPAYNDGAHLEAYMRDYVFILPDVLIVHDSLRAPQAHQFTFLLHPPPGDRVTMAGGQAEIYGKSARAVITAGGPNRQWTIRPAPVPENAYKDLDRVNLLPRQVLRLASSRAPAADFLVGMRFQKTSEGISPLTPISISEGEGFRSADGALTVLFGAGRARLELPAGEAATDGRVLADLKSAAAETFLIADATRLSARDQALLLSCSAPISAALRRTQRGEQVDVDCTAQTNLEIRAPQAPRSVLVDGVRVPGRAGDGMISISGLTQGTHVVRIEY